MVFNLEITRRCNLKCLHCGNAENCNSGKDLGPNREELSTSEWLSIIEQVKEQGFKHLIISGGEPLIRKDLWEILDKIQSCECTVSILSNGLLIDQEVINRVEKYKSIMQIRLSLDYPTDAEMETFRGREQIVSNLRQIVTQLRSRQIDVGIGMTVMPDNLNQILPVAKLAKEWGATFFRAVPVLPLGRAKDLQIDADFHSRVLVNFIEAASWIQPVKGSGNSPKKSALVADSFSFNCSGGEALVAMSAYGDIGLCPICGYDEVHYNIRSMGFKEIWENLKIAKASCGDSGGCRAEKISRKLKPQDDQPIRIEEVWKKAMSRIDDDPKTRGSIDRILKSLEVRKKYGTPLCYRFLPTWCLFLAPYQNSNINQLSKIIKGLLNRIRGKKLK